MALSQEARKRLIIALTSDIVGNEVANTIDAPVNRAKIENNAVDTSKLDSTVQKFVDVTLTAAQFVASFTTAVEIIPAPGPGLSILVIGAYFSLIAGATRFELGTGVLNVRNSSVSAVSLSIALASLSNALVESVTSLQQWSPTGGVTIRSNESVVTGATAAVTAGDGMINMRVYYRILPSMLT